MLVKLNYDEIMKSKGNSNELYLKLIEDYRGKTFEANKFEVEEDEKHLYDANEFADFYEVLIPGGILIFRKNELIFVSD